MTQKRRTNNEVYDLVHKFFNGQGMHKLQADVKQIKKDFSEFSEEVLNSEDSLRNKVKENRTSIENIKQYDIAEIKEKFKTNSQNKNKIFLQVLGGIILIIATYVFSTLVG